MNSLWIHLMILLFAASFCEKEKRAKPKSDLPLLTNTGRVNIGYYAIEQPRVTEVPPFQRYYSRSGVEST